MGIVGKPIIDFSIVKKIDKQPCKELGGKTLPGGVLEKMLLKLVKKWQAVLQTI